MGATMAAHSRQLKMPRLDAYVPGTSLPAVQERNGMRRPRSGVTAAMWSAYELGQVDATNLKAQAENAGWNLNLARSHYRQFLKFSAKPVQAAKAPAKKAKAPAKKAAPAPTAEVAA